MTLFERVRSNEGRASCFATLLLMAMGTALTGCQGGGGGGGGETLNEPGGGYGVTSNVGTYEEDYLQDESPNQDPFADNPNPIPD